MRHLFHFLVSAVVFSQLALAGGGLYYPSVHAESIPQSLPFSQNWSDANLITANDDWSGVPGIVGYRGDTTGSTTAVNPQTIISPRTDTIDVIANQSSPNTLVNGGVAEFDGITNPT